MNFPTQLTILRIILAPLFYVLFAVVEPSMYLWSSIIFLIASLTDWYDGYFARKYGYVSNLGAFLDPLADKILTSAALVAFAAKDIIPLWCVAIIIFRDAYLTGYRMVADALNLPIRTSTFAKYKTFLQMTFICYILAAYLLVEGDMGSSAVTIGKNLLNADLLWWLTVGITLLTITTALQYTYDNTTVLKQVAVRTGIIKSPQKSS